MKERVTIAIENNIALVTLNRAEKRNALDMAMFRVLNYHINELRKNKAIRAVVVHGDGEDFCSGLDVKSMLSSPVNAAKLLFKWWPGNANLAQRVTLGWRKLPVPVIFAIHGRCWGGGLQIALGGDFRFARADSSWAIMEGRWGLIPDMGGTVPFRELLRHDQLMELAMTAEPVSGERAHQLGLITHLSEQPLESAMTFAQQLAERSPDALAAAKKLYQKSWWQGMGMALFKESFYQIKILMNSNQRIAVKRQQAAQQQQDKPEYQRRRFS